MNTWDIVGVTLGFTVVAVLVLFSVYDIGKWMMRQEVKLYGCEQAMGVYRSEKSKS